MIKRYDGYSKPELIGKVSNEEWQMRVDLAACYKLLVLHEWDDLIYTHVSTKVHRD